MLQDGAQRENNCYLAPRKDSTPSLLRQASAVGANNRTTSKGPGIRSQEWVGIQSSGLTVHGHTCGKAETWRSKRATATDLWRQQTRIKKPDKDLLWTNTTPQIRIPKPKQAPEARRAEQTSAAQQIPGCLCERSLHRRGQEPGRPGSFTLWVKRLRVFGVSRSGQGIRSG